jgi:hypothetical protein
MSPLNAAGEPIATLTYTLDYPADGPKDVYALGVPKDAKVVDTRPTGDLARIVAAVKAGRDRLDGYRAVCFEWVSVGTAAERAKRDGDWHRNFRVSRITRQGDKIRVDLGMLNSDKRPVAPADGENLVEWWHRHESLFTFMPGFLCDGKEVFQPKNGPGGVPGGLQPTQKILPGGGLEAALRGGCRHHLLEGYAYPEFLVPSELFDTTVIEKPADGPPGSVQVHATARRDLGANAYNVLDYWLDPKRGYVAVRWSMEIRPKGQAADPTSVQDYRLEGFERSPHGVWYPTVVRWKNSAGVEKERGDQCRRYIVEFPAQIPDDVFKK